MKTKLDILTTPINELPLSENFYLRSKLMGYTRLQEIIGTPPQALAQKEDFSIDWLGELAAFMNSRQLLGKLQPTPGSKFC